MNRPPAGIPAGGLFSGAEGLKTEDQAAAYGGTAGVAYDPCYHQACDTILNVNTRALHELGDAAAHASLTLALSPSGLYGDEDETATPARARVAKVRASRLAKARTARIRAARAKRTHTHLGPLTRR